MSILLPASRSKITLPDCKKIAIKTGFVMRESEKMDPEKFVQILLSASSSGKGSYNQLAADLGNKTGKPMSRQAMEERFSISCVMFMTGVHCALLEQHFLPLENTLKNGSIKRILVEDSSGQRMPKSNADNFPAHGNHHGPTAGVKIDFSYDLISGSVISHTLHQATEQDKTIGKECLSNLLKGDLVLRDMGYFCLSEFTYIEGLEADWLTRLPLTTGVVLENGVNLEKYFKSFRGNVIERPVIVGQEGKKCRLIAVRADEQTTNSRRMNRRRNAAKSGKAPCAKGLIRDGWYIMITSLEADEFSVDQLVSIYRARWGVEIQFRAWKQSVNMERTLNRRSKESHMMSLVIAGMIAHLIGMCMGRIFAEKIGFSKLSYEKLYDLLSTHHIKAETLADLYTFDPDERHIKRDRRSRQSPITAGVEALT